MSMLARQSILRAAAQGQHLGAAPTNARNMATLREIELRLKSVRNIEKITKSMKMIASTKLAKAQRAMQAGKEYGLANKEVFQHANDKPGARKLFLVVSSDKGLCGGIHSSVSKATRRAIANAPDSPLAAAEATPTIDADSPVMVIGDKSKGQLQRAIGGNMTLTFNQIGRDIPTFADAAGVADLIVKSGVKYDSVVLVYNSFVSALSYEAAVMEVLGEEALKESNGFKAYENEDDDTKDLAEFSLANAIYATLVEGHACEQSARRNAMDNASKNATDMISRLQMQYNRGRQAAITNELVDIITGASAL
ncbi:ATP synthase F1 gamma [Pluteus cervinus]|uniref:ATP synthase F1 gamma n=1 Tax=Pluteus cervinus TaxID=181527 RepID=A0ACD3B4U5_9AGAR|nr:ATP synthase F1 gamma [Pluteus cervinus]